MMRRRVGPWVVLGAVERVERIWVMLRAIFCLCFLPWVVVFEGPFWEEVGRNFVRFSECDVASFFYFFFFFFFLGWLVVFRSLARLLATTILSLPR